MVRSAAPPVDARSRRREAIRAEIVDAAWEMVRERGLAGLAMRDLGERVGLKAQSLYSYVGSKHEIYDAMFAEGYRAFAEDVEQLRRGSGEGAGGREMAHRVGRAFFSFCTDDPVRYQLLFQRTIPDFVPSEASYSIALEVYGAMTELFAELGIDDPDAPDLWTAVLTGLTDQQISNDPGGQRWGRLVDRAVDMVLHEIAPRLLDPPRRGDLP